MVTMSQKEFQRVKVIGNAAGGRLSVREASRLLQLDALLAENDLGTAFFTPGDFEAAKEMYQRSLATAGEVGDQRGTVAASVNLGVISYLRGDLPKARTQIAHAVTAAQALGMQTYAALALSALGDVLAAQGNDPEAEQKYRASLDICRVRMRNSALQTPSVR
jgi:tetratricopeptide (TPR) repeat protein